jgi:hypothetical protein
MELRFALLSFTALLSLACGGSQIVGMEADGGDSAVVGVDAPAMDEDAAVAGSFCSRGWGPAELLVSTPTLDYAALEAIGEGDYLLVYLERPAGADYVLRAIRSTPTGGWTAPETIHTSPTRYSFDLAVSRGSGDAFVSWSVGNDVFLAHSPPGGGWEAPVTASASAPTTWSQAYDVVANADGDAAIVLTAAAARTGPDEVWVRRWVSGSGLQAAERVALEGSSPAVGIDDAGRIVVLSVANGATAPSLVAYVREPGGAFDAGTQLDDPAIAQYPDWRLAVAASGTVLAVWDESGVVRSRAYAGGTWSPAATASGPLASGQLGSLSLAPSGDGWLSWIEQAAPGFTPGTLWAARFTGGAWSTPETITTVPRSAGGGRVHATALGAVFTHYVAQMIIDPPADLFATCHTGGAWQASTPVASAVEFRTPSHDVAIEGDAAALARWIYAGTAWELHVSRLD